VGGTAEIDPALVTEYSEKDVMNVLARVRSELDVDDRRIYLMGHSQGGSGARHLAEKYSNIWAAVALLAPAPFGAEPKADSRMFREQLEALHAKVEFREFAGLDHGTIILGSQPEVFAFFARHVKASGSTR
jgi:pimeloyl-ACP methyl ester carboxylesterase